MLKKILGRWKTKKPTEVVVEGYTEQQVENAYVLGYNDGRRDGLAIAREQALKSLKGILWEQNKNQQK